MSTVLQRKLFADEEQVTVKYLRGLLQLTQGQLATLAHADLGVVKRAENPNGKLRYLTAVRLVDTLNNELHKQDYLREDQSLQLQHVAMHVS